MTPPRGTRSFVLAAALALGAGALVVRHAETQVTQHVEEATRLRAAIAADEALASARPTLERSVRLQRARLRSVLRPLDPTARVASFVREAARIANAHRTRIAAIVGATAPAPSQPEPPSMTPGPSAVGSHALATAPPRDIAFDVTLDGEYADVLATIRGLSSLSLPAAIDIASITRKSPNAPDTTVRCGIRVTLRDLSAEVGA